MASCTCSHDQTEDNSKKAICESPHLGQLKGTGLFVVPDPEKGILEVRVVLVADITYRECVNRGENCLSVKWIASTIMSCADIIKNRSQIECRQIPSCHPDRCHGYCTCHRGFCE